MPGKAPRHLLHDALPLIFAHDNANKVLAKDLTAGTSLPSLGTSLYAPPHQALTLGEPCVQQFTRELRASTAGVKAVEWDIKTAAAYKASGTAPANFTDATRGSFIVTSPVSLPPSNDAFRLSPYMDIRSMWPSFCVPKK